MVKIGHLDLPVFGRLQFAVGTRLTKYSNFVNLFETVSVCVSAMLNQYYGECLDLNVKLEAFNDTSFNKLL